MTDDEKGESETLREIKRTWRQNIPFQVEITSCCTPGCSRCRLLPNLCVGV
jgi:hypothetical protein